MQPPALTFVTKAEFGGFFNKVMPCSVFDILLCISQNALPSTSRYVHLDSWVIDSAFGDRGEEDDFQTAQFPYSAQTDFLIHSLP